MVLAFVPMYSNRVYLQGDLSTDALTNALCMLPWHIINIFFIHWIVTKTGFLYIDAGVLHHGNEHILDNLEEGIVILEQDSKAVMYYNVAATGPQAGINLSSIFDFKKIANDKFSSVLLNLTDKEKPELKVMVDEKRFSKIDK